MKKHFMIGFILGCLIVSVLAVAQPTWIQYTERVVGEGHPTYEDVVNRPAKYIWDKFTAEHGINGEHTISIVPKTLYADDSFKTIASYNAGTGLTEIDSTTLQLSVLAEMESTTGDQSFVYVEDDDEGCGRLAFGVLDGGALYFRHATDLSLCSQSTYSTGVVVTESQLERPVEYAVQVNEAGNITFYLEGEVVYSGSMTSAMESASGGLELLQLFTGMAGEAGPVKIGTCPTWPETGWKGISLAGESFPCAVLYFPLDEGSGTMTHEAIQDYSLTIGAGVTWVEAPK